MPLTTGSRLGSHEIVGLLGAGGMGEVYRAHDTKLNRQVAIKVLPEPYAADPERVARFQREAQAVAALNHPRIAAIYDFAEADGARFLVLELVEGDTLADRLRLGALPVNDAIGLATQILDALEAAHEKGICHRDLKPANIKVTPEGTVKVLDFGLAKFLESGSSAPNLTQSPTLSVAGTIPGVILGTAAYMSPEQAKGYQADQRSDLFSFGCIFYEILSGRQAFEGDSVSEILAGVIKSDVDLSRLPPELHPRMTDVLRRCLEKNPKKRWHAAADLKNAIEGIATRPVAEPAALTAARVPLPLWRRTVPWAAGLVLGALIAGPAVWRLTPVAVKPVTRFDVTLPADQTFSNGGRPLMSVSPDGSRFVYVANQRLYLRSFDALEARAIPGSDSASGPGGPVFSPDGQSIAFWSGVDRALKRLSVNGGAAVTLAVLAGNPYGMSWHEDSLVFAQPGKGIMRVLASGGQPEVIAAINDEQTPSAPQVLPGGRVLLYSVKPRAATWEQGSVVAHVIGGQPKTLVQGSTGQYVPSGHLVFAVQGILMVAPFDSRALALTGAAVPLVEGIRRIGTDPAGVGLTQMSFSSSGTLTYIPGPTLVTADGKASLALFDQKGTITELKLPQGIYREPRMSPDGKAVAFETDDGNEASIWIYQLDGLTDRRRLTFGGNNRHPLWSADGQWVLFQSNREGDASLFRQRADGAGVAERVTRASGGSEHVPQSSSPDGRHLVYSEQSSKGSKLFVMTLEDRKVVGLAGTESVDINGEGALSPDGRWLAYQKKDTPEGQRQVMLQPFPPTGARYLVRDGIAGHPFWTPKGDALMLNVSPISSERVPFISKPGPQFGRPEPFSRTGRIEPNPSNTRRNVDAIPGSDRVIGVRIPGGSVTATSVGMVVVLNWFEEIRQRTSAR